MNIRMLFVAGVLATTACTATPSAPAPSQTLDKADMSDAEKLEIYCSEDAATYLGFHDKDYTPEVACPAEQVASLNAAYENGVGQRKTQQQMLDERQQRLEQEAKTRMESAPLASDIGQ